MIAEYGVLFSFLYLLINTVGNIPIRRLVTGYGSTIASLIIVMAGVVPLLIGVFLFGTFSITMYSLFVSVISGIFLALGFLFFFRMFKSELLSSGAGLLAIQPALLFIFGFLVLGEPINLFDILGAVFVLFGIVLISKKKGSLRINKAFVYGIIGNVSWVIYWILVSYAIQGVSQPVLQLTVSRVVSCAVVGLALLLTWKAVKKERTQKAGTSHRLFYIGNLAGILNGLGTVLFAIVIVLKFLAIGSIITALGPALLAVFVIIIYKERPEKMKVVGIAIAVIGALLIAL